jgi:chemosensory pili system protein ChpA (sensor histidine kinase/response regulator)
VPARILLVEDTHIVREPLGRLLRAEGFEVTVAADGAEAMAALQDRSPDLVLLDVLMPRMDGIAFLSSLRSDERYRTLPVLALTGTSDSTRLNRLRELGVCGILHKVRFTFDGLLEEIRRHLPVGV